MSGTVNLFLLRLDDRRYALRLAAVTRVVRMVAITPLPKAPAAVLGLVNVQGEVLPVIDLRACFGHPLREPDPQDTLVLADAGERSVAVAVDGVYGVREFQQEAVVTEKELPQHPEYVEGVVKLADGLVLVCDLDRIVALTRGGAPWAWQGAAAAGGVAAGEGAPLAVTAREEWRSKVLRERAERLAREPQAVEADQRLEIVEFLLSGERYAIESLFIREVYPLKELTPLPCTPPYVLGIVNMRGKILSVIDMRRFFDLPDQGLSDLNKVIIVHGAGMEFGILADAILGVSTISARELQPTLPTLTEIRGEYLKGVTRERLVLLDAGKMLSDRRIIVHEEA